MDKCLVHRRAVTALMTDFIRRADGNHPSLILNHHAVAILGFFHKMCRDDYGCAFGSQRRNLPPECPACQRVYAAGRLVKKEDGRVVQ